jgi:outer membrane lipoprotein-sorting protein
MSTVMSNSPKLRLAAALLALGALSACADATSPEATLDAGTNTVTGVQATTTTTTGTTDPTCEVQGWSKSCTQ